MLKSLWQDIRATSLSWLLIWSLIYLGFLASDLFFPGFFGSTVLKLLGLFICFAYACHATPKDRLLLIALGLTIVADLILAADNSSVLGVFVFCFVHFCHMARLTDTTLLNHRLLIAYLLGAALIFIFAIMFLKAPPIIILGCIYAVTLTSNLLLSARWQRQEPKSRPARHALLGFILFAACDVCVAISYLASIGFFPAPLFPIVGFFTWPFYFPSQVLICSSGKTVLQ